ncbi:MAG: DNA polymerase III subunit alpha [Parcubacteria group bacterium]|nr:DNA polymerase III subunit alpha [Parcubacteria group bacterium]MCR4342387.1 DNA polymerase III subunit alpha [Patescibacteria group bacterium]
MPAEFVHLHVHSHYSLLDGLAKIDDLIKIAKEYEMPALALTDHGNMYGAIEFYKKCKKAGIKPIIGSEVYVAFESLHDKRPGIDNKRYHLVLLAKNETGYKNLIKLVTLSNLEGYYYKPRIDKKILRKHHEGLIGLSACLAGEVPKAILNESDLNRAEKVALEYEEIFGKGNFFLETGYHPTINEFNALNEKMPLLSKKTGIPLVATQDVHYIKPEDNIPHDTLVAIQTNSTLSDTNRLTMKDEDFSFTSPKVMAKNFKNIPEAITNSLKIADMCNIELELGKWVFPKVETKDNISPEDELCRVSHEKLEDFINREKLNDEIKNKAKERLKYELNIINTKGYAPYFLIVADIINYAHKNNIFTNTRGSAAGSFTSYLIGITNIDPLKYKLPFERFLNPDRPSPPDIDMDFADDKRDIILNYVKEKYGTNKVAQIGTFGTMMAKGSVRDVTRALGYPYDLGDRIANLVPLGSQGFPMTIDTALKITPELSKLYKEDAKVKEILNLAKKIEGCARHISVHAAGVVISPTELTDFVPLQLEPKGEKIITQYDMHAVEDAGLLKFDFLGIRNLSILGNAVSLVKKFRNIDVDMENIPLDDKKTFELLGRGETMGLFQLGGAGMTRWLRELKPSTIHDINAMVALFRPGPMENIPEYIKRKYDPALIQYLDPRLEEILSESYGVITYQDDVLLIAINLAGFTWIEADKLRKAMGKKIPAEMAAQKEKLLTGFTENGLDKNKAEELWRLIEPFAAYGFNKAHAASYGRVAYQTAYMKANFPAEYMTAVLTAESGDTEKIAEIINECKKMDIPVLPPDVNESFGKFTVIKGKDANKPAIDYAHNEINVKQDTSLRQDQIRFGLYTIKNLGAEIAEAIIEERKKNGKFNSFSDFLERVRHKNLNKKSLESLIKAGAMDSLGERGQLINNIEEALLYNKEITKSAGQNQNSLFGLMEDQTSIPAFTLKESPSMPPEEKLSWEKDLLGLYISGHPLDKFKERFKEKNISIKNTKELMNGISTVVAGIAESIKLITTKKDEQMCFMKIADLSDNIEIVVFPKKFTDHKDLLTMDKILAIEGTISRRNGSVSILAEKIKELK